jgi:hypothetical protein
MVAMTIFKAISKAFHTAKKTGRLCYVVAARNGGYVTTFEHRKDWLFKAYPGGRRQLSTRGAELVQDEQSNSE